MKSEITINPNHKAPTYLFCNMVLSGLQQKVSEAQTKEQVIEITRKELENSPFFFWGCGSSHLWIHHVDQPTERVFIAYF